MSSSKRPMRVVILNQYYVPDVASTGHLLAELADYLSRQEVPVSVIASKPSYGPPETWQECPKRETVGNIDITRMWTTRFSKDHLLGRLCNSMTFLVGLTLRVLLRGGKNEVYLYTTNPPYLGVVGGLISLIRRHPYVLLLHDSYPQLVVLIGRIREGGFIDRVWHAFNRFMYKRAEQTIVLCNAAKELVCETYDIDPERVHIVHNWADPNELFPQPKEDSEFAQEHGLVDTFTAMFSGNLGLYYEFETLLDAAKLLEGENFRLVFVGAGGRRDWIANQIENRQLTNTTLLPYQPFELLRDSLTASDASIVTIDRGVEGISYPSKLYSSLAVGRPILALSESHSEMRELVEGEDVGFWHELGDAEGLANCIRGMMADRDRCREQGERARKLLEEGFTLDASASKYLEVMRLARDTQS